MADGISCENSLYTVFSSDSKFIWTSFILQIQFFDLEGNLIPYDGHHVSISGYAGEDGDLGNLANGKTKVLIAQLSLVRSNLLRTAPSPPKKNAYQWKWLSIPFSFTLTTQTRFFLKLCTARAQKILKIIWRDSICLSITHRLKVTVLRWRMTYERCTFVGTFTWSNN